MELHLEIEKYLLFLTTTREGQFGAINPQILIMFFQSNNCVEKSLLYFQIESSKKEIHESVIFKFRIILNIFIEDA
jgi:hypothetical protein